MSRLAVLECTDTRFLPERFRKLSLAQVNARIEQLKTRSGSEDAASGDSDSGLGLRLRLHPQLVAEVLNASPVRFGGALYLREGRFLYAVARTGSG